jgi:hypothetical protein
MSTQQTARRLRMPVLRHARLIRLVTGTLLLLWAGFWAWFIVSVVISDVRAGSTVAIAYGGGTLAALLGACAAARAWPRIGPIALIAYGVASAYVFQGASAMLLMAMPAIILGGVLLAEARYAGRMPR